ncbi:MAG: collagenase [Acidobacteriota bacterium]|nr:collagenase [Acidobacteriota bacterium]
MITIRLLLFLCLCATVSLAAEGLQPPTRPAELDARHCAVKLDRPTRHAAPVLPKPPPHDADRRPEMRRMGKATACTGAEFAALSSATFADAVANATDSCLYNLWTWDGNVQTAISGTRVDAVADLMRSEGADIAANAARLKQMTYYLQIAYYHEFYQSAVTYSASTDNNAADAVAGLSNRSAFFTEGNADIASLRYQWSITVDSTNASADALGGIESLLRRWRDNPSLASDYYERALAFNLLFSLGRQVGNNAGQGSSSPWYNAVPGSLVSVIRDIALDTTYNDDTVFIIENAIYVLGRFSVLNSATADTAHAYISDAYDTHADYSSPWLRAVTDIDYFYNGILYDGTVLDMTAIRAQVEQIALPYTYTYDQGRLTFRTAVPVATAELLYDAIQEVEAQFFRKTTFIDPTTGDPNENLTLVIYASPDDYTQYQPFLYGLSTNNGGIYIENWGTLFTYERTPQDSYLTLEELLRHEYVHYLDARYVIVPGFGESPMYDNDRLTWYNEGLAEFLVGSTRDRGVLPREIYVQQIDNDSSRMTVYEIVNATYSSGFRFYRYAGMLFTYMDQARPEYLVQLFDSVRGNNPSNVDAIYNAMAADSSLQSGYDNYIDGLIVQMNNGTGIFAEGFSTIRTPPSLPADNASALQASIDTVVGSSGGAMTTWDNRFQYTRNLTLNAGTTDEAAVRDAFEGRLDSYLNDLSTYETNFTSTVAWFGNLTISGPGSADATILLEGPYSGSVDIVPPAAPTGLSAVAGDGRTDLSWNANGESDLGGYLVYRGTSSGGPYTRLTGSTVGGTSYADTGVSNGTTYYYRISAVDTSGNESVQSAEVNATPTAPGGGPPATPTGVMASALPGSISVTWDANSEPDLTNYEVHRAEPGTGWTLIATPAVNSYSDTDVIAGNYYYYLIRAAGTGGTSGWSDSDMAQAVEGGGSARVLVVDAYFSTGGSYSADYTATLDALGAPYDTWNLQADGDPTAVDLAAYSNGLVIWSIGYYYSTYDNQLNAAQRAVIEGFLDQGGSLVISGAYQSGYLDNTTLFTDYLHAVHVQWDLGVTGVTPVSGGVLTTDYWLSLTAGYYQCELDVSPPAAASYIYDPFYNQNNSSGTAVFTVDDGYKVTYFGMPFNQLTASVQQELMGQILDWSAPLVPRN